MKRAEKELKLSTDKDLTTWIRTLLAIYPTLPNIERVISSIIESRACSLNSCYAPNGQMKYSSYEHVNRVLQIIERKDKIIDLYHSIRDLLKILSKEEMRFVEMRFFHRVKPEKIATILGVSRRSVYRYTTRIIDKIALDCMDKGISSLYLKNKVEGESWIFAQYDKIAEDLQANVKRGRVEVEDDLSLE